MRLHIWLTAIGLLALWGTTNAEVGNLSNDDLKQLIAQGIPVVDVRTPGEWKQTGVIEGSHQLTFFDERGRYDVNAWMEKFTQIAGPNDPVILVCRSGNRTGQITRFLDQKVGYTKVSHLARGISQWIAKGNPVTPPVTETASR